MGGSGTRWQQTKRIGRATGGNNQFIQSAIPEHGELEFTKYVDSATPQLAYGCASQEKFPLAIFIYRRKIGLGMGGIRFPYFMIGGFKCKLKGWKIDGDQETVALHYRKIAWCGFLQWSDTNLSLPWSTRWFDQEEYKGGQYGAASGIQLIVSAITLIAGGVAAGVDAGTSSVSSDDSNL
jgi:type VI protein secretion system component Hcp